jgi:(p)ppGpp synthase/HD superfamily hydrolase
MLSETGKSALTLVHKHMKGKRNDGVTPAWQHPIDVLDVVYEMLEKTNSNGPESNFDEFEQVALLHDILEDTDLTQEDLKQEGFHFDVIRDVALLTKSDGCRFGTEDLVRYFYDLQESNSVVAQAVKCCDRIANLREAKGVFKPYRFARYQFETKMFLIPLAKRVGGDWGKFLTDELIRLSITDVEMEGKSKSQQEKYIALKLKEQRP